MNWVVAALSVLVILLGVLACSPQTAPSATSTAVAPKPQATSQAASSPASGKPGWQEQWDRTVEAANKEGTVVVYSGAGPGPRAEIGRLFHQAYPEIKIEDVADRGTRLALKIETERRAKLYLEDIFIDSDTPSVTQMKAIGTIVPLEPQLILPDVANPDMVKKIWYQGKLFWVDKDHMILGMQLTPDAALGINTNLVKPGDIKSWNDLTDPKWKGRMVMSDPSKPGASATFAMFTEEIMGPDYLARVVKNEPIILDDVRQALDWLVHGKVAIVIGPETPVLVEMQKAGGPITSITPKEGAWMAVGSGAITMVDKAPHPNAAKVFLNWLLTKEANAAFVRASGGHSLRMDVPPDYLAPDNVRQEGVNYWVKSQEERLLKMPDAYKRWAVTLAPIMKK